MQVRMKIAAVVIITTGIILGAAKVASADAKPADPAGGDTTLLEIIGKVYPCSAAQGGVGIVREDGRGTFWRYFETWQTEVVRKDDNKLVRVDPFDPRADFDYDKLWRPIARETSKRLRFRYGKRTRSRGRHSLRQFGCNRISTTARGREPPRPYRWAIAACAWFA